MGRNSNNNNNTNHNNVPSGGQRGVEKIVSYIAGFVAQGWELRIPTKHKSCGKHVESSITKRCAHSFYK